MIPVHAECGKPTQGSTGDPKCECDCPGGVTKVRKKLVMVERAEQDAA